MKKMNKQKKRMNPKNNNLNFSLQLGVHKRSELKKN